METQDKIGLDERINEAFQPISSFWEGLILHEFFGTGIPTIIFLLVGGAAFFTFYFGFIKHVIVYLASNANSLIGLTKCGDASI